MEMLTMRTTNSGQVIVSATERDVLQSAALDTFPQVRTIPVDSHGQVDGEKLASSATSAALAIIQAGNLEIGTRQRLELLADALGNTAWLCDVSGIMGFTDVPNQPTAVFADAHTFGGPAEVSVAIVDGAFTQTMQPEVSVVSAAVAAAALYDVAQRRDALLSTFTELSEHLREFVATHIADVDVLGDPVHRLPQVSAFSFLYVDAERLANDLDRAGFAIGSGSACASRFGMPSHVLRAIGALTHGNVRIGLPLSASLGQVDEFLPVLRKCVQQNRSEA
jgi:cysteine desulfurase